MEEVRSSILLSSTRDGPPSWRAAAVSGGWLLPVDSGHVGPEALEVVELALVLLEDVDDDVAVVHQHPGAVVEALNALRLRIH